MKQEIIYGLHPVREALLAGRRKVSALYLAQSRRGRPREELTDLARKKGIPVEEADSGFFRRLDKTSQGIAARAEKIQTVSLETILHAAKKNGKPFILILDGINDPQNCGAIIRSALCAGVQGVIMPTKGSVPLTPAVSKASAGALEHMPVSKAVNLVRAIKELKDNGLWIYGADASGETSMWAADLAGPAAVVIGSEGRGLRPLVKKECDMLVSIPQAGPLGSLNASVAGALIMYEVSRQRSNK